MAAKKVHKRRRAEPLIEIIVDVEDVWYEHPKKVPTEKDPDRGVVEIKHFD